MLNSQTLQVADGLSLLVYRNLIAPGVRNRGVLGLFIAAFEVDDSQRASNDAISRFDEVKEMDGCRGGECMSLIKMLCMLLSVSLEAACCSRRG